MKERASPEESRNSFQLGRNMAALESAVEWLRPLVKNKEWDYCVIWKLGDDPSSGGDLQNVKKRDEIGGGRKLLIAECRDMFVKHTVRTKACKALSQLPYVIPLYSGIHGDVVISKQPRWTFQGSASTSDDKSKGTQLLIPVGCGLIELFCTKHVPKDPKIVDYISAGFEMSLEQENMVEKSYANISLRPRSCDQCPNKYLENWPSNFLLKLPRPLNCSSLEGSSTCSSLSSENQSLNTVSEHAMPTVFQERSSKRCKDLPDRNLRLKNEGNVDSAFDCGNENPRTKTRDKADKGPYKSKNLLTERNRRKRIKDGMFALRALVPKISKMDRAATLADAADYIEELTKSIEHYHDELRAMGENNCSKINSKSDSPNLSRDRADKKDKSSTSTETLIEAQVEVNQIGTKHFLLKLVNKKQQGGFSKLLEAMDSLGLQVIDANVTTLNGSVVNILRVEANTMLLEPNSLKNSLIQLVN